MLNFKLMFGFEDFFFRNGEEEINAHSELMDVEKFLNYAVVSTVLRYDLSYPPITDIVEEINPFLLLDHLFDKEEDNEIKILLESYYRSLKGSPYKLENHPWWEDYLLNFGTCDVDYGDLKEYFTSELLKLFQRLVYASLSVEYSFEKGKKTPVSLVVSVEQEDNRASVSFDTVEPFKLLRMGLILFDEMVTTQAMKMFDEDEENLSKIEEYRKLRLEMWKAKKRICENLELERLIG